MGFLSGENKIGLALGGGAARGWAHIGVIKTLLDAGIVPDVIAGTSIGAVVGGCYTAGRIDLLEQFARSLTRRKVLGFLDFNMAGTGLINGQKLGQLLGKHLGEVKIEELPKPFTAVATEIGSGHEVWLSRGSLVDAMRASYALPGIFKPVRIRGSWLFDGALVNPVPVTVCRTRARRRRGFGHRPNHEVGRMVCRLFAALGGSRPLSTVPETLVSHAERIGIPAREGIAGRLIGR